MRNIKRTLSIFVAAVMMLSLQIPAFAAVEDTGFSDVAADAWYAEAVMYCREHGWMNGTTTTTFAPEDSLTRAMLVTILYRSAGSPSVTGNDSFTDTVEGAYYADAVVWASQQELIAGYGDGQFGTNDPVTRQQMAVILWRYAGSPETAEAASFSDAASAASYAVPALAWASANGIVRPVSGNTFAPSQEATRAQAASALMNYSQSQTANQPSAPADSSRTLVAYFSRTGENYGVGVIEKGNTEIVAEMIAEQTGADLFHIETVTPYPDDYDECTAVAQRERQENARPELTATVENMDSYDTVFLGYPIWYGDMPMAVYTFLESYDWSGKTIIPFSTHAGSGLGGTESRIASACPNAELLSGFTISGQTAQNDREAANRAVSEWLDTIEVPGESGTTAITMTVGDTVITAELSDSQTTRDFLALLPRTVTLSRYGDREYYGNPGGTLSTEGEAIPDFENGDVTFYPPSGNLAIFFGNEDTSNQANLIRMGKITSDLSVFENFPQSIEMQIAVAE